MKIKVDLKVEKQKYGNTHFSKIPQAVVWSNSNALVGDLRFKPRVGQIRYSVAKRSPALQHFFERSCVAQAQ